MLWDIFCRVIDNHGDLGVCWRLAADLAARGERVQLWVDDPAALAWMAPQGADGVTVRPCTAALALDGLDICDVLVEAFGCELPTDYLAWRNDQGPPPVWVNLEYLSAEPYVERSHGLASPVGSGPAAGWHKWFFYPGVTVRTGGLLREPGLLQRQQRWDRGALQRALWPSLQHETAGAAAQDQPPAAEPPADERWVSLFCYEPPALAALLEHLAGCRQKTRLLVTAGRAAAAVQALRPPAAQAGSEGRNRHGALAVSYLPWLTQDAFDALLWTCTLNFVRGEDSLVRALWAGAPFVWQIYPQADGAHAAKLDAMLDQLQAPPSLRCFHHAWNALESDAVLPDPDLDLPDWSQAAAAARRRLMELPDLTTQLIEFVRKKR